MLDAYTVNLIDKVIPYVNDSIWIGKMDKARWRISMNGWGNDQETINELAKLEAFHKPQFILPLYNEFKDNPIIKWRDTFIRDLI